MEGFKKRLAKIDRLIKGYTDLQVTFPKSFHEAIWRLRKERAELVQTIGKDL